MPHHRGITLTTLSQGSCGIRDQDEISKIIRSSNIFEGFADPLNHSFACIDGRCGDPVLGTPGGDTGEFLLALAIYHRYNSLVHNGKTNVHERFIKYLQDVHKEQPFYMHTSRDAVRSLSETLAISEEEVINPSTTELKMTLLDYVIKPEFIGCGHISLLLRNPEEYVIPTYIAQELIRSFYKLLWGLDERHSTLSKMQLVVLEGCHQEKAILEVTSEVISSETGSISKHGDIKPSDTDEGFVFGRGCARVFPLVRPYITLENGDKIQFFVHHGKAIEMFRYKNAKFFKKLLTPKFPELKTRHMKTEIDRLAEKKLYLTIGNLAPTLPIYNLSVLQHEGHPPQTDDQQNVTKSDA
eukprot:TRINITY_DN4165_c0_g1_i1.p1 TRINITY_DN4165_c0_g1~~TRINITY_DN4165_c0_g1_i1.p1  ORF type:complete len:355 (+),score=106.36 TRINITY_DN4165_c0_g1_i1:82-1146(+)